MSDVFKGYCLGTLVTAATALGIFTGLSPHTNANADIGIRFEDSAKAATLGHSDASDAMIKQALNKAFENYRAGKDSVIVVKLPGSAPAPGN